MSAHCCPPNPPQPNHSQPQHYRHVLWIALLVNFTMFMVEIASGLYANSVSLLADSLDFFGDAANYGLSLWVLNMSLSSRAKASLVKAISMAIFGLWVLGSALSHMISGVIPTPETMSMIAVLALLANIGVAWLLYAYRDGDSNMRSVWLCTRNDAIGNVAVILAAAGVFGTGAAWQVMAQAKIELKTH